MVETSIIVPVWITGMVIDLLGEGFTLDRTAYPLSYVSTVVSSGFLTVSLLCTDAVSSGRECVYHAWDLLV